MPAVSICFDDPDGLCLELIAILDGKARQELGIISYEEWDKVSNVHKIELSFILKIKSTILIEDTIMNKEQTAILKKQLDAN